LEISDFNVCHTDKTAGFIFMHILIKKEHGRLSKVKFQAGMISAKRYSEYLFEG